MHILSHRGWWRTAAERNSLQAFRRSFAAGYGTETDIRDYCGELVISHDIPHQGCLLLRDFFELFVSYDPLLPLALNIKSDGLAGTLKTLLLEYRISNYFCFDMSVPDMLNYIAAGVNVFARISEFECENPLLSQIQGIWLDNFSDGQCDGERIQRLMATGLAVCCVSPELHQQNPEGYWQQLRRVKGGGLVTDALMLCTDVPDQAREVLYAQ
ncbi:hypothetical protein [Tatumella sp. JGM118]|uniref:hypothetical protein n=1 Tax=Tatumella sp. JGM118 TaxID=2799796 RepID=UPI001BAFE81C|nr:hypothetical protein [Tatumella sp. JGM118]MBS0910315.1 hypothetical protein [Tatumella sp. JGM118]